MATPRDLAYLRTHSPDSPVINFPIGLFLVILGVAWFLLEGFVMSSGRGMWKTFGLDWLWNDRLMHIAHKVAAAVFVIVGVSLLLNGH